MRITNTLNLPQPFVSAVEREYRYQEKRYSATAILKGIREMILERRHYNALEQDVADMIWLIFGTAVHSVLENAQETDTQLKENKIAIELDNGYTLSGIFDLYDDSTGTVTDYKTASVWKVNFQDFDDWKKQVGIYCWMLQQIGFNAHTGEVVALLKDHSKTKAEVDASYPKHPVFPIRWTFTKKETDAIGEWINQRFREIEAAEQLPDDELPLCTPEERWHKPDKWAVKKKGNKRAHRLLDTEEEANAMAEELGMVVEFRQGEDTKCLKYCNAQAYCNHYKELQC